MLWISGFILSDSKVYGRNKEEDPYEHVYLWWFVSMVLSNCMCDGEVRFTDVWFLVDGTNRLNRISDEVHTNLLGMG